MASCAAVGGLIIAAIVSGNLFCAAAICSGAFFRRGHVLIEIFLPTHVLAFFFMLTLANQHAVTGLAHALDRECIARFVVSAYFGRVRVKRRTFVHPFRRLHLFGVCAHGLKGAAV